MWIGNGEREISCCEEIPDCGTHVLLGYMHPLMILVKQQLHIEQRGSLFASVTNWNLKHGKESAQK